MSEPHQSGAIDETAHRMPSGEDRPAHQGQRRPPQGSRAGQGRGDPRTRENEQDHQDTRGRAHSQGREDQGIGGRHEEGEGRGQWVEGQAEEAPGRVR